MLDEFIILIFPSEPNFVYMKMPTFVREDVRIEVFEKSLSLEILLNILWHQFLVKLELTSSSISSFPGKLKRRKLLKSFF